MLLTIKKNEILPLAATWIELEGIMLSKWNMADRERQKLCIIAYMWNLKNTTSEYNKKESGTHQRTN